MKIKKKGSAQSARTDRNALLAGLLWSLIGTKGRQATARSLSLDEMAALNQAQEGFRQSTGPEMSAITQELSLLLKKEQNRAPSILAALLVVATAILCGIYIHLHPRLALDAVLGLFGPLLVAACAPAAIQLLSRTRQVQLLHPRFSPEIVLYVIPSFVALLWLLFWINGEAPPRPLPAFEFGLLLFAALLGPLLEEILFREVIPSAASSLWLGHILSVLLFALLHLPGGGSQFLYYVMAAGTLSLLRVLSRGLFWPILVHALANATSLLIMST